MERLLERQAQVVEGCALPLAVWAVGRHELMSSLAGDLSKARTRAGRSGDGDDLKSS